MSPLEIETFKKENQPSLAATAAFSISEKGQSRGKLMRKEMSSDSVTIFLHIPKTGGTTLGFPLRRIYGMRAVHQVDGQQHNTYPHSYIDLSEEAKSRIRLIKGHVYFGMHEYCPGPCKYIALFRKPVQRIASLYRMTQVEFPESAVASMSLAEYVQSSPPGYRFNGQVRRVAGVLSADESCTEAVLERAKQNLERYFASFGVLERYDESLILMKRRLGWSKFPFYVTSRVRWGRLPPRRRTISDDLRSLIEEQNRFDVQFYQYARRRFEALVAEEGEYFQEEVIYFQKLNRVFEPIAYGPLTLYRKGHHLLRELSNKMT